MKNQNDTPGHKKPEVESSCKACHQKCNILDDLPLELQVKVIKLLDPQDILNYIDGFPNSDFRWLVVLLDDELYSDERSNIISTKPLDLTGELSPSLIVLFDVGKIWRWRYDLVAGAISKTFNIVRIRGVQDGLPCEIDNWNRMTRLFEHIGKHSKFMFSECPKVYIDDVKFPSYTDIKLQNVENLIFSRCDSKYCVSVKSERDIEELNILDCTPSFLDNLKVSPYARERIALKGKKLRLQNIIFQSKRKLLIDKLVSFENCEMKGTTAELRFEQPTIESKFINFKGRNLESLCIIIVNFLPYMKQNDMPNLMTMKLVNKFWEQREPYGPDFLPADVDYTFLAPVRYLTLSCYVAPLYTTALRNLRTLNLHLGADLTEPIQQTFPFLKFFKLDIGRSVNSIPVLLASNLIVFTIHYTGRRKRLLDAGIYILSLYPLLKKVNYIRKSVRY
jgi:hypothetical protein